MQRQQSRRQRREVAEAAQETTTDPAVLAAGASVLISWYYYFGRGNKDMGLFTGLWAPTILAFASYFEQSRMGRQVKRALGQGSPIRQALDQVMGNR